MSDIQLFACIIFEVLKQGQTKPELTINCKCTLNTYVPITSMWAEHTFLYLVLNSVHFQNLAVGN